MKRSTILIADDHAVVVEGLRRMLDRPEFEVVGVARDGRALLQAAAQLQPDMIIADVAMPLLNGIDAVREIRKQNRKPRSFFSLCIRRQRMRRPPSRPEHPGTC